MLLHINEMIHNGSKLGFDAVPKLGYYVKIL